MLKRVAIPLGLLASLAIGTVALADDWTASRLRGNVFTYDAGDWVRLNRGDVVSDDRVIRTMPNGRVEFVRGKEVIAVDPNSQIQIVDRTGKRFTTVLEAYGKITIEAEVQNVRHFAVKTPNLAAVVKGTRFVVISGKRGTAVHVLRGHVEVDDALRDMFVTLAAGQSVMTGPVDVMTVKGKGDLPDVVDRRGKPVEVVEMQAAMRESSKGNSGNSNAGGKSNGNGNSENSNAGGNGNSNSGGNGNSGNSNAGGNSNGNGNSESSNAGGNGNSNAGGNSNGNGNSENSNAGGNGKGKT